MSTPIFDEETLIACAELVGRTGARQFEIGYLNDEDEPAFALRGPQWYTQARFRGALIQEEDHRTPDAAAEALARRLLTGAKCKCGKLVSLNPTGAWFVAATMVDGSHWSPEEAAAAGQCLWTRHGVHWRRGCEESHG